MAPLTWPNPGEQKKKKFKVILFYNLTPVFESHGWVAWQNCLQLANKYNFSGYEPKLHTSRCLADYASPDTRARVARGQGKRMPVVGPE